MKTKITIHDVPEVVGYIQKAMADKISALAELDSLIGDGDMGVTISLVFRACVRYTKSMDMDISFAQLFNDLSEVVGKMRLPRSVRLSQLCAKVLRSIAVSCRRLTLFPMEKC